MGRCPYPARDAEKDPAWEENPEHLTDIRLVILDRRGRFDDLPRRTGSPPSPVDIFPHEGLVEDAIAAIDQGATHTLVKRVADAAVSRAPDCLIKTARGQAERLMDGGKSQYYGAAARWLARARDAYRAENREPDCQDPLVRHGRKRSPVPLLQALR